MLFTGLGNSKTLGILSKWRHVSTQKSLFRSVGYFTPRKRANQANLTQIAPGHTMGLTLKQNHRTETEASIESKREKVETVIFFLPHKLMTTYVFFFKLES